jgi:hemolysin activation/secretion protein
MSCVVAFIVACLTMLATSSALAQPVAAAVEARFDLLEYEVEGNTVLPALAVEQAVLPHMGAQRTMAQVDAARAALEKAYQDAGYLSVLVDLPEQRIVDGVVRLRVLEGRIDRVRVTGARYFSQDHIRAVAAAFQEGEVPNFNLAQAQLADLNRTADRQVQPVLRAGLNPGTVDVELKVKDQLPLSGSVEVHNHHAANTDALRLSASLRYDNLLQRDHTLAINLSTAPRALQQTQVLTLGYTVPAAHDASWVFSYTYSNSTVEPLGNTVLGSGNTVGLRWTLPFGGSGSGAGGGAGSGAHTISVGGEFRDLQQQVRAGTGGTGTAISTPLRYLPFVLGYSGQWRHEGMAADAQSGLQANFSFGIRGLLRRSVPCPPDNSLQDQFACNRDGADGGFATLRLVGRHSRPMFFELPGTFSARLTGQLAGQPLVSGEQLTAGGADSVRGYFEAEASGDLGVLAGLQWQSPNWAAAVASGLGLPERQLTEFSALGFLDGGRVRSHDPQPGQAARSDLAGAGLGLRLGAAPGASAEIDLAWPLKATPYSPSQRLRLHARLALRF